MITHTMIVAFDETLPDAELDQYLADIERAMRDTGLTQSIAVRRHLPIPGEEAIPALVATAIVQVTVADTDTLAKAFAAPGLHAVIGHWQSRYPYKVAWANHEPLS
ncbi:hypothetical protein [Amycolatopsis alba]|uniref:Stress-response A/B barrel domain-containing protein n=1 Tax=Amycolatopsis alba DSM 44262 TaxID=1125972 RepID=A0A229RSR3_AMYAL|nr:hypothetical protein [Amycolatopsis alba]OXM49686.1 hypothetical protein CFP75_18115 [Amycolatopsis alba DSM 44262]